MRLVLDTSVLVAALRSRTGASWAVLKQIEAGALVTVASPVLFLEYEEVLRRGQHRFPADQVDASCPNLQR